MQNQSSYETWKRKSSTFNINQNDHSVTTNYFEQESFERPKRNETAVRHVQRSEQRPQRQSSVDGRREKGARWSGRFAHANEKDAGKDQSSRNVSVSDVLNVMSSSIINCRKINGKSASGWPTTTPCAKLNNSRTILASCKSRWPLTNR